MTVVSCDGFLEGGDFKDSIENQLEYINSKTMTVKAAAEYIKQGDVLSDRDVNSVHVNDTLALQFTANRGYILEEWVAVDEHFNIVSFDKGQNVSSDTSKIVEFSEKSSFKKNNLDVYTVKARFTGYKEGIWIVPRVTASSDTTAPYFYTFQAALTADDLKNENLIPLSAYEDGLPPVSDFALRRGKSLHIKLSGVESDSILRTIYIVETLKKDSAGLSRNFGREVYLDREGAGIRKTGPSLWAAEFDYTPSIDYDGIFKLDFYLIDSASNISKVSRTLYFYKDTQITPASEPQIIVTMPDLDSFEKGQKFSNEELNELFNKFPLTVNASENEDWYLKPSLYSDYSSEDISVPLRQKISLIDRKGKEYTVKIKNGILDITGIPRTCGLTLRLTLSDDLGNEKSYDKVLYFAGYGYSHVHINEDGINYIALSGGTADTDYTNYVLELLSGLPGNYSPLKPLSVFFYQKEGESDWTYDFDDLHSSYNYVLNWEDFKDTSFKYYRIRAFRPFNNKTEEYETMLQTLASDLVTVKPDDITEVQNQSWDYDSSLAPQFTYEFASEGNNSGKCTLTVNITNWEEKGYESCYFYLEESYSSLDGTYTESTSAQNVLSGIPYGTVAAANKIYVQVYAGSYFGYTEVSIPSSAKPQDNAPPVISIAFGNTNFLGNILNFSASDSNSSVNSSSCRMYYSTVKKERTAEEIKELDYLEPSTISGSTYYIPVWKLEEDLFYGYAWAEDTHGNYAYKEFKFDTRYRTGFFEKSSSSASSRHSSSAVVPVNNKYYNAYYLPSGRWARLSYTAGISYYSQYFNLNVLSGYTDDDDPLTGIFTRPFYYYAFKCEPLVKMLDNVTTGKILVTHDAPVLIETYWSEKDFGTDITKWIMHTDPSNAKNISVYYPAENDTSFSTYTVNSSVVPSGNYYCAIIHFADGSEKISQIWQKD